MRTLADFKRALTLGSKWLAVHNQSGNVLGVRTVGKVQVNGVGFKSEGKDNLSWLYFPKASEFETDGRQAFIFSPEVTEFSYSLPRLHILTYTEVTA